MMWNESQLQRSRVSPGTRLNGIYEIECQIGIGGMGEVYKGHAIQTGDPVAIKMMLGDLVENEAALALFRREASALHQLQHDAIVRYYVFTIEPVLQRPYLAMEFVDGRSLSEILHDAPLPFEAVRALMQRLTAGLQAAHDRGIVHRDVSPDNIIVPQGDVTRAKIIDFGIARSSRLGQATVIGSGFAGKHNYVSPEQLGLFGGDVTAKSDIYSLGLVLYEALTGRPLDMGGSQVEIVDKRRRVPDLGAIDLRLRPLLERMLQPDPNARPPSMAAVATWSLGLSPPGAAVAKGPDPSAGKADRRGPGWPRWRYAAAALAILLLAGGAGGAYYFLSAPVVGPSQPTPPSFELSGKRVPPTLDPDKKTTTGPDGKTTMAKNLGPPDELIRPRPGPRPDANTPGRTQQLRQYVERYDGGECFFVMPVAIGEVAATLEGFGASTRAFEALDRAFLRDQGFEAQIGVRQVMQAQCPAITFLNRLRSERARAPRLRIDNVRVRNGEVLGGTVEGFGSANIELLLVSDTGRVHNVSNLLKPATEGKSFEIGMKQDGLTGSQPQLLVAIATAKPLESLRMTAPVDAQQLFPAVLAEAERARQNVGAIARYFKLEN
jgi:serine/threonine-protein kinase